MDPYDATRVVWALDGITTGYGADITITFKANDRVDAEKKIAFVQTALEHEGWKSAQQVRGWTKRRKKVNESRMIPSSKPAAGTHIDQLPDVRTPLYGTTGNRGDNISEPEPAKTLKLTEIGWHYKDAGGNPQNHDAMMHDEPDFEFRGHLHEGERCDDSGVVPAVRNVGPRNRRQPEGDVLWLCGMGMEEERFRLATDRSLRVQDQV